MRNSMEQKVRMLEKLLIDTRDKETIARLVSELKETYAGKTGSKSADKLIITLIGLLPVQWDKVKYFELDWKELGDLEAAGVVCPTVKILMKDEEVLENRFRLREHEDGPDFGLEPPEMPPEIE